MEPPMDMPGSIKEGEDFWIVESTATTDNFDGAAYLSANPDVADALGKGLIKSAQAHFENHGAGENRKQRNKSIISDAKRRKHERIRAGLKSTLKFAETEDCFDFLTAELRNQFDLNDAATISRNGYDGHALALIEEFRDGLILDCGSGRRDIYFKNVVNFEIANYDTTDVVGVGEDLPFRDETFDAVFSLAVLEHVKDPFQCASEISRVLKPGGKLMCCVPFLQPYHGYPHHYYNMTQQGLSNLFSGRITIDKIDCYDSILPIWSLTWILNSWRDGLKGGTRKEFENLRIGDLLDAPANYLNRAFVRELTTEKNFELASATTLFGHKPLKPTGN